MDQTPATFGVYSITRELGRGTTGVVYEARHAALNRRVAVKVLALASDAERSAKATRFHRECRALAYLTSESGTSLPVLYDVGECQGRPYCVRELIDGGTLEQRAAVGPIDVRAGLGVIAEVARVVDSVHGRGFAHRNLSPANVLIARDGTPRLIGFGRVGLVAGSELLPPGSDGVPAAEDKRGLHELVHWLFEAAGQSVPADLDRPLWEATTPVEVGAAIRRYL